MRIEFRKVLPRREIRGLLEFDRKVFPVSERFDASYWTTLESYWMVVDGVKVGCCAFKKNTDFQEDVREDGVNPKIDGSLYIASTGILPRLQGSGLGMMLKCWQVYYAKRHKFRRIVTNTRKSNKAMVSLNKKFGFRVIRTTRGYYSAPGESTVVMELCLV